MQVKSLGLVDYAVTYAAMQTFTTQRTNATSDELWLCEHPPVFTQGLAGKPEHLLIAGDIPVVHTNRGGQITYHGPGQIVAYPLLDLKTAGYFVKEYVYRLEEALIRTLAELDVTGHRVRGAPGIYVRVDNPQSHAQMGLPSDGSDATLTSFFRTHGLGKIAALGIKVNRHFTLHGAALNVAMDLAPFSCINPCGYAGLETVDLRRIGVAANAQDVSLRLAHHLQAWLVK